MHFFSLSLLVHQSPVLHLATVSPSFLAVLSCCVCSFSLLITWPKKRALRLCILFMNDLASASHNTRLISLQSMRFSAISVRPTFMLPPVSFVAVLKLSSLASTHQNGFKMALKGSFSRGDGNVFIYWY